MASVVGMAVDLQLVEMLFTSLLVQATRALTEAGNAQPAKPGYRSGRLNRSPSFRRAFLLAYATRAGERLAEADRKAGAEASSSHGAELVPVLARRSDAVDSAFDRLFPETRGDPGETRGRARMAPAGRPPIVRCSPPPRSAVVDLRHTAGRSETLIDDRPGRIDHPGRARDRSPG